MADAATPSTSPAFPRRLLRLGLALAVLISLALTFYPVFDRDIQLLYSTNPDAMLIAPPAERATWRDALGWWAGPWIEESMPYYRPLTSMLFWAEYRLWGRDFQKYCVVSWLAHAANGALLFLLALSLFQERPPRTRMLIGLLVVFLFSTRRNLHVVGYWEPYPIAWGEMPYWAAQTDLFSLLFSLLSLLVLDRWAQAPTRRRLASAVALFVIALLFKEMAVATALLAPLLVWYRQRRVPWLVGGWFVGLALVFLALRWYLVPGAWGPEPEISMSFGRKLLFYLNNELFLKYGSGIVWPIPAALGLLVLLWALRRYGQSLIWLIPGGLIWTMLACQLFGSNFTAFTILNELWPYALSVLFWGGLVVLVQSRSWLNWTLAAMVAVVHMPIMHVIGPHYQYWPAAFWSLLSGALLLSAGDWWRRLGARREPAED